MRLEGWEGRLHAAIEEARSRPYELGEHDCFRLASRVVSDLTGVDHWPAWSGYRTRREAMALLASRGHGTFEEAFDWLFGSANLPARLARRGDVCAVRTEDGQKHLGVCLGVVTALLAPEGLVFVQTESCLCHWRIG